MKQKLFSLTLALLAVMTPLVSWSVIQHKYPQVRPYPVQVNWMVP